MKQDIKPMLLIRTDLRGLIDILQQMNHEHDAQIAALSPKKAYERGYLVGRNHNRKAGITGAMRQNSRLRMTP